MPVFPGARRVPARPVRPSFRDSRFVLLLAGQSASWVCSWAAALVLWGFAAYHFGAGPEALSVTALCWSGPPVVLTAFTGGLTDRFGPRTMLIIGYACSAATSLGMAGAGSLTSLDLMAAACGAARSLCSPASSALPARVVKPGDLLAANSLLGVTASIGQVAGPLAASVLFAWGACGTVFSTVAATTLQRSASPGTLGRVAGAISTAESTVENVSMPLAGALIAIAGLRPGALVLAAVAVVTGAACLPPRRAYPHGHGGR